MADNTAAELAAFTKEMAELRKSMAERKAAPVATQTEEAAVKQAAAETRERYTPDRTEEEKARLDEIGVRLMEMEKQLKAQKLEPRAVGFEVDEAKHELAHAVGLDANTKDFMSSMRRTLSSENPRKAWAERFGEGEFGIRSPMKAIINGGLVKGDSPYHQYGMPVNVLPSAPGSVLREMRDLNDGYLVWRSLYKSNHNGAEPAPTDYPLWQRMQDTYHQVCRALDETDTANWVPSSWSGELIRTYELQRTLVPFLRSVQIPRSPFFFPVVSALTSIYKISENTADPESATAVTTSDLADLKATFTLKSIGVRTSWSYELDEDSIVMLATETRTEMARAWAYAEEVALLSGDTTATHRDSNLAATGAEGSWMGLRFLCIDGSCATSISSLTVENLLQNTAENMNKWAGNTADLFWVFSPKLAWRVTTIKDSQNNAVVYANARPEAQIGGPMSVTPFYGVPVCVSQAMPANLNASGVYDGTTTTKFGALLVNRTGFGYGYITPTPTIESQRWIRTRQLETVMSLRRDFIPFRTMSTTNSMAWYAYNF